MLRKKKIGKQNIYRYSNIIALYTYSVNAAKLHTRFNFLNLIIANIII